MPTNLIGLVAAVHEALANPQSLVASTSAEKEARLDLIDLIPELNATLVGDVENLRELSWSVSIPPNVPSILTVILQAVHVLPIAAINRWGLAKLVPDAGISYAELAQKTGISESMLQRTLRHAMTARLFLLRTRRKSRAHVDITTIGRE